MASTADTKDDATMAQSIGFLILFSIYLICLAYACYKLYSSFTEARIFRIIKSLIVAFLILRTIYWTDPLCDFPLAIYNLLEVIPNFLLYIMGQMIAYEWIKVRLELRGETLDYLFKTKLTLIVMNGIATTIGLVILILQSIKVGGISGIYTIAINFVYAFVDLGIMLVAGLQLKYYIQIAFPGFSTHKITQTLIYSSFCYAGRSVVLLSLSILMQTYPNIKTDNRGIYWAIFIFFFYCLTDIFFLALILKIVSQPYAL
mmetsp:Transcript_25811/g.45520  ORF Transcript_25811/g.45520 Transcript_25811/m.45520 type:complete len:259 (+) Transcript_25811:2930-3706(+)